MSSTSSNENDDGSSLSPASSQSSLSDENYSRAADTSTSSSSPIADQRACDRRREYNLFQPVVPELEIYWPPRPPAQPLHNVDLTESSSAAESSSSSEEESDENLDEEQDSDISSECENDIESSDGDFESSDDELTLGRGTLMTHYGSGLTVEEGVLCIMDLFIKYKMEKVLVKGVLESVLRFLPKGNNMPKSKHSLFKYVDNLCPLSGEDLHYYCSVCHFYIGENVAQCPLCEGECHKFFQLSLSEQIRNFFENHGLADVIETYNAQRQEVGENLFNSTFSDMCDGTEFKRARADGLFNLTLLGHTDGLSISESSSVTVWPSEFVIAEIPSHLRFKFILISGIWVDECKPLMNTFLKPTVKELQTLHVHGVKWKHPKTEFEHTTHVTAPVMCADAPARAQLQNILSHGGKHCCNICEQKMKKLPQEPVLPGIKKKARRRVFDFEERDLQLRTAERMELQGRETRREHAARGGQLHAVKGVRGSSIVSEMPGCDRSTVVFPEYMHLVLCLGKEFMSLWFEKDGPWSLKSDRDRINAFLLELQVPDFLTRIPRSTDSYTSWKANELRSFLLYFSVVVLASCMKPEYFQHWILLVMSLFLLLQDKVSDSDIAKAEIMLRMFCRDFSHLYKADFFTYYVHNLLHLPLSVKRNGPLWCNSAFQFEDFNGRLTQFIHGTKNQGQELVNNVKIALSVEILRGRVNPTPVGSHSKFSDIRLKNKFQLEFSDTELSLFTSAPMAVYYRALLKGEIYTCLLYQRQKRRNNFTISHLDSCGQKVFGEIKFFCELADGQKMAVIKKLGVDHLRTISHMETGTVIKHIIPVRETTDYELIELGQILCKVIRVNQFVCLRSNKHEYNL